MSRRNLVSNRDKMHIEEDNIDKQLKDAGIWEEGLSVNEKRQLLELIADSRNTAKEEEIKRKQQYKNNEVVNSLATAECTPVKVILGGNISNSQIKENCIASEDNEPIITYESATESPVRRPSVICENDMLVAFDSNNLKPENKSTNNANSVEVLHVKTPARTPISLLSTKKLLDTKPHSYVDNLVSLSERTTLSPKNSSVINENCSAGSESCFDIVNCEEGSLSAKGTTLNVRRKLGPIKTSLEKISKLDEKKESQVVDNCIENSSLNGNNSDKSTFYDKIKKGSSEENHEPLQNTLISKIITEKGSCSSFIENEVEDDTIFSDSENHVLHQVNSVSNQEKNCESRGLCKSTKKLSRKRFINFFDPNLTDDVPLKKKLILSKENEAYSFFKCPLESNLVCVRRIYSLISEFQSELVKYQRKHPKCCKWGLPLTVDRQIKHGLVKEQQVRRAPESLRTRNCTRHSSKIFDNIIQQSQSSGSETHISSPDPSDNEWDFKKNKKKKIVKKYIKKNNVDCVSNSPDVDDVPLNVNCTLKIDNHAEVSNKDANYGNASSPLIDSQDVEMNSTITASPKVVESNLNSSICSDKLKSSPNSKINCKVIRKSFQIPPCTNIDQHQKEMPKEASESHSSFISDSSATTVNHNNNSMKIAFNTVEDIQCLKRSVDNEGNTTTFYSGNKRKKSVKSLHFSQLPPLKKKATENRDIELETVVRPGPLRYHGSNLNTMKSGRSKPLEIPLDIVENKNRNEKQTSTNNEKELSKLHKSSNDELQEIDASQDVVEVSDKVQTSIEKNSIQCPICLSYFAIQEIEAHASGCNGPDTEANADIGNNSSSLSRRRLRETSENQREIDVLLIKSKRSKD